MPQEIEHKYLVRIDVWKPPESGVLYRQGYLSSAKERVVRVRIAGEQAFLTIKGQAHGITRLEFEYAIPKVDAATMLDLLCERPLIEKTRYRQPFAARTWEIDVFHGDNAGLVVAELEVADESDQFELPPWLGREVSGDARYFNSILVTNPFKNWRTQRD
jgi:CYTH domain-containing protein